MGNFFAELKRRQIFRVAAAYAVVAWLLLQVFNNLTPVMRLPDWAGTLVLVFLVGGFPITLLAAWARELGPDAGATVRLGASKLDYVLIGGLALVIALASYEQLAPRSGASTAQQTTAAGSTSPKAQAAGISIAVLPFVNLSGDAAQEFFSDGMTEEITSALAKVRGLTVLGRTSAFQFKGQNRDLRDIGQALGATHLIEGSVRKAGTRVRITAQLIRADSGAHLWTENYDRELTDIFAVQEDIAQAIAGALRLPLGLQQGDALISSLIQDPALYETYLRAKALVKARGFDRLTEAATLLDQVTAREPDFAPAWAQLALAHVYIPFFHPAYVNGAFDELRPFVEANLPKVEVAARRAIALDPKNAEGFLALSIIQGAYEKPLLAQDTLSQALALDPNNPEVLYINSVVLADLGDVKQALSLVQRLQKLEPFVPAYNSHAALVMWLNGQTEEAIATLRPIAASDTGLAQASTTLARLYTTQGRYVEAADVLQNAPRGTSYRPDTLEAAARLLRSAPASAQPLPQLGALDFVYAYVGAPDRALDFKERAHEIGIWSPTYYYWARGYESIRKIARFKALMRDTGILEYWRAKGWPDLCRPQGTDDFVCD